VPLPVFLADRQSGIGDEQEVGLAAIADEVGTLWGPIID
jgi:hypothetical protein